MEDGRVARGGEPTLRRGAERVDCGGRTLMPGISDAHVHGAILETDAGKMRRDSPATVALRIQGMLEQTLAAGFATVRDAFGLDWGFVQAGRRKFRLRFLDWVRSVAFGQARTV